jgi:hypothetical protein
MSKHNKHLHSRKAQTTPSAAPKSSGFAKAFLISAVVCLLAAALVPEQLAPVSGGSGEGAWTAVRTNAFFILSGCGVAFLLIAISTFVAGRK